MSASIELQTDVFKALGAGNYPVQEVSPSTVEEMPLITIQDFNRETNFTKTNTDRFTYSITVHGWSSGKSSLESKQIEEFIYQTVMNLKMTNYKVELVNLSMVSNLRDEETEDRVIFHSIQQFEITISKIKGDK